MRFAGSPAAATSSESRRNNMRINCVMVCRHFDDFLDVSLTTTTSQFDEVIVVTSPNDAASADVCERHGAQCVPCDALTEDGFDKGAAVNAGLAAVSRPDWVLLTDADVLYPMGFARALRSKFVDPVMFYWAERIDLQAVDPAADDHAAGDDSADPVHLPIAKADDLAWTVAPSIVLAGRTWRPRGLNPLCGPWGYFQLFHISLVRDRWPNLYLGGWPRGDGTDSNFASAFSAAQRKLDVPVAHIAHGQPGDNWAGRSTPRLDNKTIPKIFHHIWLGGPLPPREKDMIDTWKRHHPEWEFRLWTDTHLPAMPYLKNYYDAAATYAVKADMVRYEAVYAHGGVYVDTDIECLRPIDGLLEGCGCFAATEYDAASCGKTGPTGINNGIFGAAPRHAAMLNIIQDVPKTFCATTALDHGPRLFRRIMHARSDVRIFEKDLFHPLLPHQAMARGGTARDECDHAYAIHWFNLSWMRQISAGSYVPQSSAGQPASQPVAAQVPPLRPSTLAAG
jgi:mannosyltransferase OCH1-like enzyme